MQMNMPSTRGELERLIEKIAKDAVEEATRPLLKRIDKLEKETSPKAIAEALEKKKHRDSRLG